MEIIKNILEILSRMHLSDLADVTVISVLVFVILRTLHQNIHRRVLIVFFAVALLYLAAQLYHWQLTLRFIEIFAFSMSVGCILVFQEDIRRFLESSLFSVFSAADQEVDPHTRINILIKSVATFSKNRVGALIVIQQKIPIIHVARGGHRLNGEVSFPLLCSIFDTHSIGHDGAVIIKGNRVTRFGVHLPLSRKHELTGRGGTRHAAALGLSELTDAFTIVVSEETGEIGVAEFKEFKKVNLDELRVKLEDFRKVKSNPKFTDRVISYLKHTFVPKIISVSVALILWVLFVAPGAAQLRTFSLPITMEAAPKGLILDEPFPQEFKVSLSGTAAAYANWPKEKQVIRVSLENISSGIQKIPLTNANLNLPSEMNVTQIEPSYLTLKVYNSKKITVPVSLQTNGRSLASATYKFKLSPKEVTLIIREGDPGPSLVTTEALDVSNLKEGDAFEVKIIRPANAQFVSSTLPTVKVSVEK